MKNLIRTVIGYLCFYVGLKFYSFGPFSSSETWLAEDWVVIVLVTAIFCRGIYDVCYGVMAMSGVNLNLGRENDHDIC